MKTNWESNTHIWGIWLFRSESKDAERVGCLWVLEWGPSRSWTLRWTLCMKEHYYGFLDVSSVPYMSVEICFSIPHPEACPQYSDVLSTGDLFYRICRRCPDVSKLSCPHFTVKLSIFHGSCHRFQKKTKQPSCPILQSRCKKIRSYNRQRAEPSGLERDIFIYIFWLGYPEGSSQGNPYLY